MQKLFNDEILSGYSYIGFKGKKTFSTLQTCTVIFGKYLTFIILYVIYIVIKIK